MGDPKRARPSDLEVQGGLDPPCRDKGVGRKISRGGESNEKMAKICNKVPKIALLCLFQRGEGQRKKDRKMTKKSKKSTIKPLSTISVPCENPGGVHSPPCPPLPTPKCRDIIIVKVLSKNVATGRG